MDEEGLHHVNQVMEAKATLPFSLDRIRVKEFLHSLVNLSKFVYSTMALLEYQMITSTSATCNQRFSFTGWVSYNGDVKEESVSDDDDNDDDYEEFNSDDSNDEGMGVIAKEFGVKRYGWLVYMDKKVKEEERSQKEVIKGPSPTQVFYIEWSRIGFHVCLFQCLVLHFSGVCAYMLFPEDVEWQGEAEGFSVRKRSCPNHKDACSSP
ncbi:hypothetical protein Ancab_003790 [Ancistrocladus abbreviatus]